MERGYIENGEQSVMRRKKQVLVAINTLTSIAQGPYMDHMRLYYHLGRRNPKYDFHQMVATRVSIDRFRNNAASIALKNNMDYLMFIDDDMRLPIDVFEQLVNARLDIAAAHTYIRGYPYKLMSFKAEGSRMVNHSQEDLATGDKVLKCAAVGTAVSLIKVDLFRRIPPAWFVTGTHNTEDIYFCVKAKQFIKNVKIGMVKSCITGHELAPEVISYHTRQAHMGYMESFMTPLEIENIRNDGIDHGKQYVQENLDFDYDGAACA